MFLSNVIILIVFLLSVLFFSAQECYGVSDPEKVKRVKQLYTDLDLPKVYSIYEEETYNLINEHLQQISYERLRSVFLDLLGKLYRRQTCYV